MIAEQTTLKLLFMCYTNQHTDEPQVCFMVFLQPGSIDMKPVADEAYHRVVCEDDQDEENHRNDHNSNTQEKHV